MVHCNFASNLFLKRMVQRNVWTTSFMTHTIIDMEKIERHCCIRISQFWFHTSIRCRLVQISIHLFFQFPFQHVLFWLQEVCTFDLNQGLLNCYYVPRRFVLDLEDDSVRVTKIEISCELEGGRRRINQTTYNFLFYFLKYLFHFYFFVKC